MKIILKKMKLFGFLSYGDAEIDFRDRGYCLLTGINKNPKDSAKSNGSGKSSLLSAICWALTGETIQGLKSNIANINLNKGCFVELEFDIDKDSYKVIRYKDYEKYKSDLKIFLNDKDISGKGIKDSEEILARYLPDLSSQLIASVIILGQGLPNKFSSNTPAGRKEVLEKLSKSDFMIQDIKNRIDKRYSTLSDSIRSLEDNILKSNTTISIYKKKLDESNLKLIELQKPTNFNEIIDNYSKELSELNNSLFSTNKLLEETELKINDIQKIIDKERSDRDSKLEAILTQNQEYQNKFNSELLSKKSAYNTLDAEIKKLDSIIDICPTCGQKIPNVIKVDTSSKKEELAKILDEIKKLEEEQASDNKEYINLKNKIIGDYQEREKIISSSQGGLRVTVTDTRTKINQLNSSILTITNNLNKATLERDNHDKALSDCLADIKKLEEDIKKESESISNLEKDKLNKNDHLAVISKMNTLVKRDFRGFLLKGIIDFIDSKAKEYSEVVFKTRDLNFELDGNNINISYCGKSFENLSGGEKQRVDLIIQFAIREMMSQYLGFSANILCLDEITDNLDAEGCDAILDLIAEKISDVESLFIISHRSSDLGIPYDNEIIIEKDEMGVSRINDIY